MFWDAYKFEKSIYLEPDPEPEPGAEARAAPQHSQNTNSPANTVDVKSSLNVKGRPWFFF